MSLSGLSILQASLSGRSSGFSNRVRSSRPRPAGILARMLFLTPAVACDRRGVRLGRGGGFYDRLLARENRAVAAIVYACQLTESLPREPHDRMVGFAVTEEDILTF